MNTHNITSCTFQDLFQIIFSEQTDNKRTRFAKTSLIRVTIDLHDKLHDSIARLESSRRSAAIHETFAPNGLHLRFLQLRQPAFFLVSALLVHLFRRILTYTKIFFSDYFWL